MSMSDILTDHSARLTRFEETDLYVVITEAFCGGRPALAVLDACLTEGVGLVQFREKHLDTAELFEKALVFRDHTQQAGALLMVNDRIDLALAVGADGVHLGQQDMPMATARRIAPELLLGASSHNLKEALHAQETGASYVNIGPIFPTETKDVPTGVVGPEMLEAIAPQLRIPFTCMGGIKAHNVDEVTRRGARHVAVVTAVTAARDIRGAVRELREKILQST
jgi:thiamine-phosphate pyrophosphorylase